MEREFWEESWEAGRIGFHQEEVHHYLRRFYWRLGVEEGERVFVPLCGKSLDMLWLRRQGATVVGVELSPLAVSAFFAENALEFEGERRGAFDAYRGDGVDILLGDLFDLVPADLGGARAVYDRGSLVALPPSMRRDYANLLAALLPSGSRVLVVGYDYDQGEMAGPPFSVAAAEVEELFGADFSVEKLACEDALESHEVLRKRGLSVLREEAYLLLRR